MASEFSRRCGELRELLGCRDELIGESAALACMLEEIRLVARRKVRVLLTGPTGVGKTTVARVLHRASGRKGPFVSVNAAALPPLMAESLLFGHERGAFTGAEHRYPGLIAEADGGTLFLDEVGDLDPSVQAKLLTFLDRGVYRGLGLDERKANVRLLTATNKDLSALRTDLLERMAQFTIAVPSLSERPGDIPLLAEHALCRMAEEEDIGPALRLAPDAEAALVARVWPNNVRELERVLLGGDLRARAEAARRIRAVHLFPDRVDLGQGKVWKARSDAFRKAVIEETMFAVRGRVAEAARLLGVSRASLYAWIDELGLGADEHGGWRTLHDDPTPTEGREPELP
jgi:DNA-binding NtrC family response regulator